MHFFWVGHFKFFFSKKKKIAFFPWKLVKVYWLARMAQHFDQAKNDNTLWPMPNILKGSVCITENRNNLQLKGSLNTSVFPLILFYKQWFFNCLCSLLLKVTNLTNVWPFSDLYGLFKLKSMAFPTKLTPYDPN